MHVFFTRGGGGGGGVATLQAIFRTVKHVRMLLIMFLNSKFVFALEMIKVYAFLPKIMILLETISREVFYYIG